MRTRQLQGSGAPTFCWQCGRQLRRAPGKGKGLFYFDLIEERGSGVMHRVHGACTKLAIADGHREQAEFTTTQRGSTE